MFVCVRVCGWTPKNQQEMVEADQEVINEHAKDSINFIRS